MTTYTFAPRAEILGCEPSLEKLVRIVLDEPEGDDDFYESFCASDESILFDFVPINIGSQQVHQVLSEHFGAPIPDSMLSAHLPELLGYLDTRFPGWDRHAD